MIPSSPPVLHVPYAATSELPTSPPLLPPTPTPTACRKRQLEDHESHLSSDPLFSESSGAEDVTGYSRPKRKRMVAGPWWTLKGKNHDRDSRLQDRNKDYGRFRNVDSGVFMGSDTSDASVEYSWLHPDSARRVSTKERTPRIKTRAASAPLTPEDQAARIIEQCADEGREVIDLANLGLTQLGRAALAPLHHLIRLSAADSAIPPSEDAFTALVPNIKLFLYGNQLTEVPAPLFGLQNITALSIRNNRITELPAAIGKLPKLHELNITSNNIEYLPFELMKLLEQGRNTINIRPNPLLQPTDMTVPSRTRTFATDFSEMSTCHDPWKHYHDIKERSLAQGDHDIRFELELRLALGRALRNRLLRQPKVPGENLEYRREELILLGSSAVQRFGLEGLPHGRTRKNAAVVLEQSSEVTDKLTAPSLPSLFELSLRAVQRQYDLGVVPDDIPPRVKTALYIAAEAANLGNEKCSVCGRVYIIARANWIEYWFNGFPNKELTQEGILPFIRKVCSFACIVPTSIGSFR